MLRSNKNFEPCFVKLNLFSNTLMEVSPGNSSKLANMSLDDFVDNWDESDSESNSELELQPQLNEKKVKKLKKKIKEKVAKKKKEAKVEEEDDDVEEIEGEEEKDDDEEESDDDTTGANVQKKYIKTLRQKDPEFFEFLKVSCFILYLGCSARVPKVNTFAPSKCSCQSVPPPGVYYDARGNVFIHSYHNFYLK